MINSLGNYINDTIAGSTMSKEENDIIKIRVISIRSRIETVIFIFFKLLLFKPLYAKH